MKKIGVFTGTFDPFTIGHQNIADRAKGLFDMLIIYNEMISINHFGINGIFYGANGMM